LGKSSRPTQKKGGRGKGKLDLDSATAQRKKALFRVWEGKDSVQPGKERKKRKEKKGGRTAPHLAGQAKKRKEEERHGRSIPMRAILSPEQESIGKKGKGGKSLKAST